MTPDPRDYRVATGTLILTETLDELDLRIADLDAGPFKTSCVVHARLLRWLADDLHGEAELRAAGL